MPDDPWKLQVDAFGEFIRTQRKLARLSLRELAARAEVSNAYLSQLERGRHAPSIRVMRSLADAFNLSVETMLQQAGLLGDDPDEGSEPSVEVAIRADPHLDSSQKDALLTVYRGFVGDR